MVIQIVLLLFPNTPCKTKILIPTINKGNSLSLLINTCSVKINSKISTRNITSILPLEVSLYCEVITPNFSPTIFPILFRNTFPFRPKAVILKSNKVIKNPPVPIKRISSKTLLKIAVDLLASVFNFFKSTVL